MTLKITIDIDNAAFEDDCFRARDTLETLAASLGWWPDGVISGANLKSGDGPIMDTNGNTVGKWSVTL